MANRLEQMAPLLVSNLRQNRTHLLCSQRIIAYTKLQLARAGRSLGLSTALAARQQREGAGITTPAGCQLQREFATHAVALSLLLSNRPTQQLSFRQFAVLRPSTLFCATHTPICITLPRTQPVLPALRRLSYTALFPTPATAKGLCAPFFLHWNHRYSSANQTRHSTAANLLLPNRSMRT